MIATRTSSVAFGSFVWGAVTALSLVYIYNSITKQRKELASRTEDDNAAADDDDDQQDELLWDHPDLDLRLIRKAEAAIQGRTDKIIIVIERCTNDHNYSAILRTAEALGIQTIYIIDPPTPTIVTEDGKVVPIVDATTARTANEMNDFSEMDADEEASAAVSGGGNYQNNNNRSTMPQIRLTSESDKKAFMDHRKFAQNATEWLTICEFPTATACLTDLRRNHYQVWVTDLSQEAVPLTSTSLRRHATTSNNNKCWPMPERIALVMGTEAVGCSQEMLVGGDLRVYLPLVGFADSLNLSVATALILQQVLHLGQPHQYQGNMSESNRRTLRQAWYPKLAQQRLLSSRGKKQRKALLKQIQICQRLQARLDDSNSHNNNNGSDHPFPLTPEQLHKLSQLSHYQQELERLETTSHFDLASNAIADLINHPPQPISDLRRADPHRVTFVGKKTKQLHQDHWKDLVATTNTTTTLNATASFFRNRILGTQQASTATSK